MISRSVLRIHNPRITTSSSNPLLTLTRFNSSSSSSSAAPKPDSGEVGGGGSHVYQESRKFGRPATVTWSERLRNSVSLIGTVEYPIKQYATNDGKVTANELNYVQVPDENYLVAAKSEPEADEGFDDYSLQAQTNAEKKHRKRLHLWQLLFANPDEWYDQRKTKKSARHPDFKHKSTGEALWLNKDDPSWIRKQVDLLDSRLTGRPSDDSPFGSFTSEWVSDNQVVSSDSMESSFN